MNSPISNECSILVMTTDSEIMSTFVVMHQLRPHLSEDGYLEKIRRMQREYDFTLAAVVDRGEVKAVTGFRITESLCWGRYLYVDDLITDQNSRKNGYAKLLFEWLSEKAHSSHCEQLHLDSGVHRFDAHRFYLNQRMDITCHHFQRGL